MPTPGELLRNLYARTDINNWFVSCGGGADTSSLDPSRTPPFPPGSGIWALRARGAGRGASGSIPRGQGPGRLCLTRARARPGRVWPRYAVRLSVSHTRASGLRVSGNRAPSFPNAGPAPAELRNDEPLGAGRPRGSWGAGPVGTLAAHLGALHLPADHEQEDAGARGRHRRGCGEYHPGDARAC